MPISIKKHLYLIGAILLAASVAQAQNTGRHTNATNAAALSAQTNNTHSALKDKLNGVSEESHFRDQMANIEARKIAAYRVELHRLDSLISVKGDTGFVGMVKRSQVSGLSFDLDNDNIFYTLYHTGFDNPLTLFSADMASNAYPALNKFYKKGGLKLRVEQLTMMQVEGISVPDVGSYAIDQNRYHNPTVSFADYLLSIIKKITDAKCNDAAHKEFQYTAYLDYERSNNIRTEEDKVKNRKLFLFALEKMFN